MFVDRGVRVFLDRGVAICRSRNVCKVLSCVNVWTKPCKGLWAKKDTNLVPIQATHQYTGTGQFKDSSKVCSNEPHFTQ